KFWKHYMSDSAHESSVALFQKLFPKYEGRLPFDREEFQEYGDPDDAQIIDKPLFQQLKRGFSQEVSYSWEIDEPNVIFTEDTDAFKWPKNSQEAANFWVVVIDYHC